MRHETLHRKPSLRLRSYDYCRPNYYYVTVCMERMLCRLGTVTRHGQLELSPAGKMVQAVWLSLSERFPTARLDRYIVMPNHTHAIVELMVQSAAMTRSAGPSARVSLGRIVGWFKSRTIHEYILGVKHSAWQPFPGKLWQRDYFDRVVRGHSDLRRIRDYIEMNPFLWATRGWKAASGEETLERSRRVSEGLEEEVE